MILGKDYHGGFKVGDKVEVRFATGWNKDWIIKKFQGRQVLLQKSMSAFDGSIVDTIFVPLDDIRHPHLVRKK